MDNYEAKRIEHSTGALSDIGFDDKQIQALRRASSALRKWRERERSGEVQRDAESGVPFYYNTTTGVRLFRLRDAEKAALVLIKKVVKTAPAEKVAGFTIRTDTRGAALYILRPGDVPEGADVDVYYSKGVCVF